MKVTGVWGLNRRKIRRAPFNRSCAGNNKQPMKQQNTLNQLFPDKDECLAPVLVLDSRQFDLIPVRGAHVSLYYYKSLSCSVFFPLRKTKIALANLLIWNKVWTMSPFYTIHANVKRVNNFSLHIKAQCSQTSPALYAINQSQCK